MAIPAVKILVKYPCSIRARPQVFRLPWDSVVRPDEILIPGEKFFLVSRRTVKKLRQKIKKPDREASCGSLVSKSSNDVSVDKVSCRNDDFSSKSFCQQSDAEANDSIDKSASKKKTAVKKHVRFVGIEEKSCKLEDDPGNMSLKEGLTCSSGSMATITCSNL